MVASAKKIMANRDNARKSTGPKSSKGKAVIAHNAISHGMLSNIAVIPGIEQVEEWELYLSEMIASLAPKGKLETILVERIALLSWRMNRVARYEREAITISQEAIADDLADTYNYRKKISIQNPNDVDEAYEHIRHTLHILKRFCAMANDVAVSGRDAELILFEIARQTKIDLEEFSLPGIPDDIAIEEYSSWTAGKIRESISVIAEQSDITPDSLMEKTLSTAYLDMWRAQAESNWVAQKLDTMRRKRILPDEDLLDKIQRYETHLSKQFFQCLHELQRLQAMRIGLKVDLPKAVDIVVSHPSRKENLDIA